MNTTPVFFDTNHHNYENKIIIMKKVLDILKTVDLYIFVIF